MTINETDIDASDVKIQVYAHSQIGEDRQLVCTLPINDVCGAIRWHSELPKTRRVEEGAEVEYLVDERWEMVREDDEGQHWKLPEHKAGNGHTMYEQTVLIENHEQFQARREKMKAANIQMIYGVAKAIRRMYFDCGDFWDDDCTVEVSQGVEL
jgi:hypothetical protein